MINLGIKNRYYRRALIPSIVFNLKYLPFEQAVKLPILVHKLKLICQKGKIIIDSDKIYRGMIQLGFPRANTFPNNGITWKNEGKIVFNGSCIIGNDCYVVVGHQGNLVFGQGSRVNAGSKIVSMCSITIGANTRFGWGNIIIDSNFHNLYDIERKTFKSVFSPIVIGDYNWFTTQCFVMQGVQTPERCIFAARSIVSRADNDKFESYCVHGGSPLHVLSRNVMRDYNNDIIRDYTYPQKEK